MASMNWDNNIINHATFQQILDLDEGDPDLEFTRETINQYLTQVDSTLVEIEDAYARGDLPALSSLGHFLKGSSAALGVVKVHACCEEMQHVGKQRDEINERDLTVDEAKQMMGDIISRVKKDAEESNAIFRKYIASFKPM